MPFRTPAARAACATFGLTLPVYLATMNRTVGFIDRGELAAAACTFGIAHAPGYPTLMLLAGGLARISPLRPVLTLNLFAAVLVAAGAAVLALLFERVLHAARPGMPAGARAAVAATGALFAAFTLTWWEQANGFEVYALHALMMPLVVLLGLRWIDAAPERARGAGWAFGLATGLSFTNHLTTGLLAPGLIAIAIARLGWRGAFWRRIVPVAPAFLLGLLPYAWLPIRSAMQPRFDWGDPETAYAFWRHVTAADYHRRLFSDATAIAAQTRYLLWRVPWDFAWIGLPLAGIGMVWLARTAPRLALMAGLFTVTGLVFAAGYQIPDIEAYVMTALLGIAIAFTAGLAGLTERFGARRAVALAALLIAGNLALHWRHCDERRHGMAEAFVHDMIDPLPPNAVLYSMAWDIGLSASGYFQEVEGYRRDVVVVVPDLTRVSWYLDELARHAPELAARAGEPYRRYRNHLHDYERRTGEAVDGATLERERGEFLAAYFAGAMRDRPVFSTDPIPGGPPAWRYVPYGLAHWVRTDTAYVAEPPREWAFELWNGRSDLYVALTCWGYGDARLQRARYEAAHGRRAAARAIAAQAATFDPGIRLEQVGPLPLAADTTVIRAQRFFRRLNAPPATASAEAASAP
jgi:MFS family permease